MVIWNFDLFDVELIGVSSRIRKMACNIPMFLQMLESNPQLAQIHPYTKVYSQLFHYRTDQGRMALEDGNFEQESDYRAGTLKPGSLHVVCYLIGLKPQIHDGKNGAR